MAALDMIETPNTGQLTELCTRENCDEKVELFWQPITCRTYIRLTTSSDVVTRRVPNDEAMHAFNHPYMYVD